jgi:hypothetical protein
LHKPQGSAEIDQGMPITKGRLAILDKKILNINENIFQSRKKVINLSWKIKCSAFLFLENHIK